MAFQALGWTGDATLHLLSTDRRLSRRRRPVDLVDDDGLRNHYLSPSKRPRYFEADVHFRYESPPFPSEPKDHPEFLVLREDRAVPVPHLAPDLASFDESAPGLSISADVDGKCASAELLDDAVAAQRVDDHMAAFRRRSPDSKHERILRSIIKPKPNAAEYDIDDDALQSIFSAANEIFFNGRLSQRVTWDWPHSSSRQYDSSVIGTTALRSAGRRRGFETLIVLSSPVLRDRRYSRRLLISTFLHELIHSYLFICRGFGAKECGGHTPGFHRIAKLIDDWAGPDSFLYLCNTEADLNCFRLRGDDDDNDDEGREGRDYIGEKRDHHHHHHHHHVYLPCSSLAESRPAYRQDGYAENEGREWWPAAGPSIPYWQR